MLYGDVLAFSHPSSTLAPVTLFSEAHFNRSQVTSCGEGDSDGHRGHRRNKLPAEELPHFTTT